MAWGAAPLPLYGQRAPNAGGTVTVGAATRYARLHPAARPPTGAPAVPQVAAAPTWTPPPLGSYNPARDVEVEEGERGLGQLQGETATGRARDTSNYFIKREGIEGRGREQDQNYATARAALERSFAALQGSQEGRAQAYGVASGGALLQSAAKRAINEGLQKTAQDTAHTRQHEGTERQLAELALELAPPDASNPEGGRQFQDLNTKLTNAEANQIAFEQHQHSLAGAEAAQNSYAPPEAAPAAPAHHAAPAHGGRSRGPARPRGNPFARFRHRGL